MKKFFTFFILFTIMGGTAFAADNSQVKRFHGTGEVTSVDPMYSRITIQHDPISGFISDPVTEFSVKSPDLLKKISKSDLVSFDIEDNKGDVVIVKIERTGQAPAKQEGVLLGQAAQEVLEGAGQVVKTVASPIAPVGEVANATADATTNTTGSVLNEASPEFKKKF